MKAKKHILTFDDLQSIATKMEYLYGTLQYEIDSIILIKP